MDPDAPIDLLFEYSDYYALTISAEDAQTLKDEPDPNKRWQLAAQMITDHAIHSDLIDSCLTDTIEIRYGDEDPIDIDRINY